MEKNALIVAMLERQAEHMKALGLQPGEGGELSLAAVGYQQALKDMTDILFPPTPSAPSKPQEHGR